MARLRQRTWLSNPVSGTRRPTGFSEWTPYSYPGVACFEWIQDTTHSRLKNRWSGGGPMTLNRDVTTFSPSSKKMKNSGTPWLLDGSVRIVGPSGAGPLSLGLPSHPSEAEINALSTSAIAAIEPTHPAFDLSVFIGELRMEGLPNLPGQALREKTRIAKSSGSEYLNVDFGWLPLVRGVRDFATTVDNADKILTSYQQRANVVSKRSYEWPDITSSQAYNCSQLMEYPSGFFTGGGHSEQKFVRKWMEVDFIYYLPTGDSAREKISRYGAYARKLLGIDLTPEVLWNLSPWSWAADWFSNTGDVMHNISAFGSDGLVMRNGYTMCHSGLTQVDSGSYSGFYQVKTRVRETKTRHVATPYGFGVSYDGLSARQIATVAALGLSRWG